LRLKSSHFISSPSLSHKKIMKPLSPKLRTFFPPPPCVAILSLVASKGESSRIPTRTINIQKFSMKPKEAPVGGWLFKEEPGHYSFSDLERDGETWWDGVDNNLARKNLRLVQAGNRVLYYHTGKEKAIVGEMLVAAGPTPDPGSEDPKAVMVKVRALKRWPKPLTLERIKKDPTLSSWDLVRNSRLSVMPVSAAQWQRLLELRDDDE
jgi:predicted RNA-binding protein with PUA-like domain